MATLEELLKQSKFRSEGQKSVLGILYAANLIRNNFEGIFNKYDLTVQQYNVLRILRGQYPNPSTINLIRERMLDRMSDASRIVERLRKSGMVERVPSEKDRRAVDVIITQKGMNILTELDKLEKLMDAPIEKMDERDCKQLNDLLQKIFDTVD